MDDITGKELSWSGVRQAREQELKSLRDLGVYEKVEECEAIAKYQVSPVDTKCIDANKAFEEETMHLRSRFVAREFKGGEKNVEGNNQYRSESQANILKSCTSMCRVRISTPRLGDLGTCAGASASG